MARFTARRIVTLLALALACAIGPQPAPPHASSSELAPPPPAALTRMLAEREYWVSPTPSIGYGAAGQSGRPGASEGVRAFQAPNRAHGLRSHFEPTGLRVEERAAATPTALLSLRLAGIGRADALASVAPGTLSAREARVELTRAEQGLVEWFVNSPAGLEQGFTLAERPTGRHADPAGPLVLELAVEGAAARRVGDAIRLSTDAGRKLAYGKLFVVDAEQKRLAARFEVPAADRIRIEIEDRAAVYPIVVDPLLAETADALLTSNLAASDFGASVASAGDVNGDGYDDVAVGAPRHSDGQAEEGAVFVFHGGPNGIGDGDPSSADAVLQSNQAGARFGASVASAGDVNGDGFGDLIVGAPRQDGPEADEGMAFVFLGSAAGIVGTTPVSAHARLESDQAGSLFGSSVASAGDVNGDGRADVLVGAPGHSAGQAGEGAAFVFLGGAVGIANGSPATAHATFQADQAGAAFGASVASAGDIDADGRDDVIVGAPFFDSGQAEEGAAFVFRAGVGGLVSGNPASAHAEFSGDQAGASLGIAVAGAGDVDGDGYGDVVVGASLYDSGEADEGAAFVFRGSAAGLVDGSPATASARIESDQEGAGLGVAVARAGDVNGDGRSDVAIGAFSFDPGIIDMGLVAVALGSPTGIANGNPASGLILLTPDQAQAELGVSVGPAGDVDGDGFDDLIAGAPRFDDDELDEGAAFLYAGGSAGFMSGTVAGAQGALEGDQFSAALGASVASAGDLNGDGYGDLVIGAPDYDAGQADEGAAFVFLGSASGIGDASALAAATRLESDQPAARLGASVASAGDLNGDGYGDLVIGASAYDAGQPDEGAAFVFHGGASGIASGGPATAQARLESDQAQAFFATSVASAGDLNGDGFGDLVVGAPSFDAGQPDEGGAFVFLGSPAGVLGRTPPTSHARLESDQASALFGASVASAGDLNGDGFGDLAIGAPAYDAVPLDEGAVFVFLGSATGLASGGAASAHARLESDQTGAELGASVASAGDVDGDGFDDLVVGAPRFDQGESDEGLVLVHLGSAIGLASGGPIGADARIESDQAGARFGTSVASAGDVDGDGYGDLVLGAPNYDFTEVDEGVAFVYLGSASGLVSGGPHLARALIESNQPGARLGASVAAAGDVDGDGHADLVLGAPGFDAGASDEGLAFVFQGNRGSSGRPLLARQRRGDGSNLLVAPTGRAFASDRFRVELFARSDRGRERARLEVEVCPASVAFGDVACVTPPPAPFVDLGVTGALLSQQVVGLAPSGTYSWRVRTRLAGFSATQPGVVSDTRVRPWFRQQTRAARNDIRTLPEPATLGLVCGALAIAGAASSTRSRALRARQRSADSLAEACAASRETP